MLIHLATDSRRATSGHALRFGLDQSVEDLGCVGMIYICRRNTARSRLRFLFCQSLN